MNLRIIVSTILLTVVAGIALHQGYASATHHVTVNRKVLVPAPVDLQPQLDGTAILNLEHAYPYGKPGEPAIPRQTCWILIPAADSVIDFSVSHSAPVLFGEGVNLAWNTQPQPLMLMAQAGTLQKTPKNSAIYQSDLLFPSDQELVLFTGVQTSAGTSYAMFLVATVQYQPSTGNLFRIPELEITVTSSPDPDQESQIRLRNQPSADVAYLVVTSSSLSEAFEPLITWKRQKGLTAEIRTIEWISTTYPGVDSAEQLRNFLIDSYQNWNTHYVLLGGDSDIVPMRQAFAMDCEAGFYPDENDIPCDLYFAALDGSWNADADAIFGETTDQTDLLPELQVGRAPVTTLGQAETFVQKCLAYEQAPPLNFQTEVLFLSEVLWDDPLTDGGIASDMIDAACFDDRYDPIDKRYETLGNLNKTDAVAAMNQGPCFVNHIGHANFTGFGVNGWFGRADADVLTNGAQQFVLASIGCWPAAFDKDCLAEHFIYNPAGGAIAFIGNSRYGWGSPGNPGYGYSDFFNLRYWYEILQNGNQQLGPALSATQVYFAPYAGDENVFRWVLYELNLLGDPELAMWTDIPETLTVVHPSVIPLGSGSFSIVATVSGEPLVGGLVTVNNNVDFRESLITPETGSVAIEYETASPDPLGVTVTGNNVLPYYQSITVAATGAFAAVTAVTIDDDALGASSGNNDSLASPGETIELRISLHNTGTEALTTLAGELSSLDPNVSMLDPQGTWPDLAIGGTASLIDPFVVAIAESCPLGRVVRFELEVTYDNQPLQTFTLQVKIVGPQFTVGQYWTDPSIAPGIAIALNFYCHNNGYAAADNVILHLETSDPYLSITGATSSIDHLPANGRAIPATPFDLMIASGCPEFYLAEVTVRAASGVFEQTDRFNLVIGATGFYDDMESGAALWTHAGVNDLWNLTNTESASPTYSWYFGSPATQYYVDNAAAYLETVPFNLAPNSTLRFHRKLRFTNYGVDGCYVEIGDGEGYHTLDFIGSGGALGILPIVSDWCPMSYDLASYSGEVTIRFRFVSDAEDVEEGIYLDDVVVSGDGPIADPAHTVPAESAISLAFMVTALSIWLLAGSHLKKL